MAFPAVRVALVAAMVSSAGAARADPFNRNLLPIGEREALLANAGITSATGGAAFYNPANLARIDHPSISMTGTTVLRFELSTDALFRIEGQGYPFEAAGLLTVPASLVTTRPVGEWSLATAVMVPDAFEAENQVTFETATHRATMLQKRRAQELWLGAAIARQLAPELHVGVSAFAVQHRESDFLQFSSIDQTVVNTASQVLTNTESSYLALTTVAGLYWQPCEELGVGVRAQSPLLQLSGKTDSYSLVTETGAVDSIAETEYHDLASSFQLPLDVGIGLWFAASSTVQLMLDVNLQTPLTYEQFDADALGDSTVELDAAVRASLAAEIGVTPSTRLMLGLLFNGSAAPALENEGDSTEDYLGGTVGVVWKSGRTQTGLGAFWLEGSGELIPIGDALAREDVSSRLLGGLITVAYRL